MIVASHPLTTSTLVSRYLAAKRQVLERGYAWELVEQEKATVSHVSPQRFLDEYTWVVMSAGMSTTAVEARYPLVADALHRFWPHSIVADASAEYHALSAFNHQSKVRAILSTASTLASMSAEQVASAVRESLTFIESLPWMGPATSRHLAKNLGHQVAKPDRHLVRVAQAAGRSDCTEMCVEISEWLEEPVSVVDVVLWRWSTFHARECRDDACAGLPHG